MVAWVTKDLSSFHLPALPSLACAVFLTITTWEEMGKDMKKKNMYYLYLSLFIRKIIAFPKCALHWQPSAFVYISLFRTSSHEILQLQRNKETWFIHPPPNWGYIHKEEESHYKTANLKYLPPFALLYQVYFLNISLFHYFRSSPIVLTL